MRYIILTLLLLSVGFLQADNHIQALRDSIQHATDPLKKADFLRLLANEYRSVSPHKADSVGQLALQVVRASDGDPLLEARILFQIGNVYRQQSLFGMALDYYREALPIHESIASQRPANLIRVAYTYNQMGLVYKARGEYDKAIEAYQKALRIKEGFYEEHGEQYIPTIVNTYTNIGAIYNLLEDGEHALQYHRRGEALLGKAREEKFERSWAAIYANISHTYLQLEDLEQAETYLQKQFVLLKTLEDEVIEAEYYANFAEIQFRRKQYDKAIDNYQQAIVHYQNLEDTYQITWLQFELGGVYQAAGNMEQALHSYHTALQQAQAIESGQLIAQGLLCLSEWYEQKGDLDQALKYYKQHIDQKGLLFSEQTINALKEMEVLFAPNHAEDKVKLLELQQLLQEQTIRQNRIITGSAFVGLLFALLVLVFLAHNYRIKRQANEQLAEKNHQLNFTLDQLNKTVHKLTISETRLSEANSTKNKMFSIVSHDLRGQLGSIMSFAQMLNEQADIFSPEEIKVFGREFYASSRNVFSLMENLVQWAKAQMEEVEYSAERFSLNELIAQNIELQQSPAQNKKIELISEVEGEIAVETDINMMHFVLRNLMSNALKFTHEGGKITVAAKLIGQEVQISVADNGVGIPPKVKEGLFKIASHTTTRGTANEKGTGLGLLLCDEFARKMGSPLQLETEVGEGTTFYFSMPVHSASAERVLQS